MHRSGTSFLVRALNLAGVNLGTLESLTSHEWKFYHDNVRGHWENKKVLSLTKQTLSSNKGSWDNPPQKTTVNKKLGKEIVNAINELMEPNSLAGGFKDPRIILCLDSWQKYLPRNTIVVGIFRHPLKVAESLKIRDGFSYEKSINLWKVYNEKLMSYLEKHDGFLIDFDWPKKKLLSEVGLIIKKLGLYQNVDLSVWYSKEIIKADKTYQTNYRLSTDVRRLYSKLKKKSKNNARVKVKKITRTSKELESIVQNLLVEKQIQGQYFKTINQENLALIKNIKKKPKSISSLISIYSKRPDLRETFPEVVNGDYTRFVNWGISVAEGQIKDEESGNKVLSKFLPQYKEYLKSTQLAQTELTKKIHEISVLNEKLNVQNKVLEENEAIRKKLESFNEENGRRISELEGLNQENALKIGELEGLNQENARKIGELEGLNQENARKIGELERVKDENARKIGELEGLNQENARKIGELERVKDENARKIQEYNAKNVEHTNKIKFLEQENQKLRNSEDLIKNELDLLKNSIPYKISRNISDFLDKKLPEHTKLGKAVRKIGYTYYKKNITESKNPTASELFYDYRFDESVNEDKCKNEMKTFHYKPKISIIMPVYNTPSLPLNEAIDSVTSQIYDNLELCICDDASTDSSVRSIIKKASKKDSRIKYTFSNSNGGISNASNKALALASGEFVCLLDHDDKLTSDALFEIIKILNHRDDIDYIYSDEDKIDQDGKHIEPFFKPDWSPDLFLSINYVTHLSVIRKTILDKIRGFRPEFDGSQDYDLILRVTENTKKIAHIPKILYSWRQVPGSAAEQVDAKPYAIVAAKKALQESLERRGMKVKVSDGFFKGSYRIKYQINGTPLISIIILNKKDCLESIGTKTSYDNYEIIIVDNDSTDSETLEYLDSLPHKVIRFGEKFNFSKMNNLGVNHSKGEYMVFLNNDTKIIDSDWLQSMLEHVQKEHVGIAGAKLLFPDNHVQHAGIIVGFNGYAHNYGGFPESDNGYFGLASTVRNCSAVTAACMMTKRKIFEEIGGFDEEMKHSWQDVDFCLRVLAIDKTIVYTPYSLLYHITGGTRGQSDSSVDENHSKSIFRKKNDEFITKGDPYYNPNLSTFGIPYSLEINLTTHDDPMGLLLRLYMSRKDLQESMPEVKNGNYSRLLTWATTSGLKSDSAKYILEQFSDYYRSSVMEKQNS